MDRTVLVIDDDKDILELMELYIHQMGYACCFAEDDSKGLELIHSKAFDLIIIDIKVPEKGGIEFIKKVRTLRGDIPMLAFSGYGAEDIIKSAYDAGVNEYIVKPVSYKEMKGILLNYLEDE